MGKRETEPTVNRKLEYKEINYDVDDGCNFINDVVTVGSDYDEDKELMWNEGLLKIAH